MALVVGDEGDNRLIGTSYQGRDNSDEIHGYGGNDHITAGGGSDTVYGGDGNDTIFASYAIMDIGYGGSDTIFGGAGNDRIYLGPGANTVHGDDGDDIFVSQGVGMGFYNGGNGTDTILLLNYNGWDGGHPTESLLQINSLVGVEAIQSQSSLPSYIVSGGGTLDLRGTLVVDFDGIRGDLTANDTIYAEAFYDFATATFSGAKVDGQGGNDTLIGSALGDTLRGGTGDDTLYGGAGNDQLFGGTGADLFWFDVGQGTDTIYDWTDGTDKLVLGTSITSINLYNSGGSALLELGNGTSAFTYALLSGVAPSAIDGSDFLWA